MKHSSGFDHRMMKIVWGIVLALWVSPVDAQSDGQLNPEPHQLIRSLRILQDQVVTNNPDALVILNRMLGYIGRDMAQADRKVWSKPENIEAAVVYLFNGGNPAAVRDILVSVDRSVVSAELIDGALAYAHGRDIDVVKLLSVPALSNVSIDLKSSIALVTTEKMAGIDPVVALQRLDQVRLEMPGTIFEEAAIRRSLPIAVKLGDVIRFRLLTRSYLQRFRQSPYLKDFLRQFVDSSLRLNNNVGNDELLELISGLSPVLRYSVCLQIARSALISGQTGRSRFMSIEAKKIADKLNKDAAKADLYLAASIVSTGSAEDALHSLSSIAQDNLPEEDRQLLRAAKMVGTGVVKLPAEVSQQNSKTEAMSVGVDINSLEIQVKSQIKEIDALLGEIKR